MAYCTKCGKENPDTAKFCTGCGNALISDLQKNENNIATPENSNVKSPNKKIFWAIAALVVAGVAAYFLFFHKGKSDKTASGGQLVEASADTNSSPAKKDAPDKEKKNLTLRFVSFSFGDLTHYDFKDNATGEDYGFTYQSFDEKNTTGWESAVSEITELCDPEKSSCELSGKLYSATLEYMLTDEYEWNGEQAVKTGKTYKDWVVTRLKKISNNTNVSVGAASYLSPTGRLIFQSDCYIIVTGSYTNEQDAKNEINRMRNNGYSNAGYLWIPDYQSLSEKPFWAPFIGPYQTYDDCKTALSALQKTGRFWYGVKVSNDPQRIEIRL